MSLCMRLYATIVVAGCKGWKLGVWILQSYDNDFSKGQKQWTMCSYIARPLDYCSCGSIQCTMVVLNYLIMYSQVWSYKCITEWDQLGADHRHMLQLNLDHKYVNRAWEWGYSWDTALIFPLKVLPQQKFYTFYLLVTEYMNGPM